MSKIYAVIGTNSMTVVADSVRYNPATNEVLMRSERPSDGDYIANEDGTWVEDKQKKLDELDAQYQKDKREIMGYYNEAAFYGDEDLQSELKEEMANVDKQYEEDRKAIEGE